jgi:hypothetical protein
MRVWSGKRGERGHVQTMSVSVALTGWLVVVTGTRSWHYRCRGLLMLVLLLASIWIGVVGAGPRIGTRR